MRKAQRVIIVNGSPRTSESATSAFLAQLAERKMSAEGIEVKQVTVRKSLKGDLQSDFEAMRRADGLLFIFPLYFFCLPGMLMRFLQDYAAYHTQHTDGPGQRVYTIVNCGFPEPAINTEAVRVMASFSHHIGAAFGFGVCIGGGGMLEGAKDAPFMKPVFAGLEDAFSHMIQGEAGENVLLAPKFPRSLYFLGGNMGWRQMARKNGLKPKDLYRTPYAE